MRFWRVSFVIALAVAWLAGPAVAAAAPSVSVAPTGQLSPEGASAAVSVTVTCDPGWRSSVSVSLAQSSGKHLVQASGSSGIPPSGTLLVCDGTPHIVSIRAAVPQGATRPLKAGKAEVTATVFAFDPVTSQSLSASTGPQEVRLLK